MPIGTIKAPANPKTTLTPTENSPTPILTPTENSPTPILIPTAKRLAHNATKLAIIIAGPYKYATTHNHWND